MRVVKPEELAPEEGALLVRLARKAIRTYLSEGKVLRPPKDVPEKLLNHGASFVTLLKVIDGERELRGCIGYVKPVEPLVENVIHAAIAAATQDPRFPPLSIRELGSVIIEVSVLSEPEPVKDLGRDRLKSFTIGNHGLVIRKGFFSGLLLPEVPVEFCWDNETFLAETCIKAGLHPDCWLDSDTELYRFTARTFREVKPDGEVVVRNLAKEYEEKCSSKEKS